MRISSVVMGLLLSVALVAQDKEPGKVQKALGKVGGAVDKAAEKTVDGTKTAAGKTADATKTAAGKTADATKTAAGKTADTSKTVAGKTADTSKTVAGKTAGGAKTAAGKTADGAEVAGRTTVGTVGEGASRAGGAMKSVGMLDLNTATMKELEALPGIGDAYSEKIVKGRPYTRKDELVSKGILPETTYEKIKNRVVARKPKN